MSIKQILKEELLNLNEKTSLKDNILYLHGLDSTPEKDGVSNLSSDYNIISPQLDYRNESIWKNLEEIIKESKPIAIMGHSIGGYLAYYLSNEHSIPTLMFNPAFNDKDLNLLSIPNDIKNLPLYNKQMAIVGLEDDVIKPEDQIKQLEKGECDIHTEKIGHDITKDILIKYFNKFIEEYINKKIELKEAILSQHIKERLISRFIDRREFSVGYEIPNRVGQYKIVGTYILSTEFKNNLIENLNFVANYNFPTEKSYGIKIGQIDINKHNVRFSVDNAIKEIQDKTLVIVDQDTNSNGNVIYLIIRDNKVISIYFAKSYVRQTPEKLRVDTISNVIEVRAGMLNESLNEFKLYGHNDTRLRAWDKLIKSVENKFKIKLDYFFGGGSYGIVFDIGDNKLVKLTTDNDEYETAKKLKGKHNEYLADIYEVYKFKEFPSTKIIFLEKLEEIPSEVESDCIDLENMISSSQNGYMRVSELLKDVVWRNKNNKDWFLDFLKEKFPNNTIYLKLYDDLKKMYQEGINNKILIDDIHIDNLGYKHGHLASFDIREK